MATVTVQSFDPTKDKSYRQTKLGADIVAALAWLKLAGMSERTRDQYERDWSRGALMFPDKSLSELTDDDALHIAASFKDGERRVRVAAWKTLFKFGRVTRRTTRNPFEVVPTIKRDGSKVFDTFTEAEIASLEGLGGIDGPLFAIMFGTGGRKGDFRRVQLKHFRPSEDPEQPDAFAFLWRKGRKQSLIPVPRRVSSAVATLATLEGLSGDDYLWYSVRANEISRKVVRRSPVGEGTFARWYADCLERAGVRYRNPHTTRHTFATNWLRNGGRLETLSMILGHASIRTTFDEYAHLDTRDVLADLALIEGRS